ncbi:MAG TPA: TolC family protein [Candidatus Acidoferrales bacterium]|nr:TolC family protein [Candidatus Acidoferrales bacterium]
MALVLCLAAVGRAEVHPMTLRQAVALALKQNPEIELARLDEESARHAVRIARDPFLPHVTVGSGLAYTNGFPMSVEGSAPAVFQARASQYLFNRPQSYAVAQAKESARGAAMDVANKRDEIAYRTASLYLDAERSTRVAELARKEAESLQKVLDAVRAQVAEGRALPLVEKQAAFTLARARQIVENLEIEEAGDETSLAVAVGLSAADRVHPVIGERPAPSLPASEEAALQTALESSHELRKLQSQIAAKGLEIRGEKAARLPRADLIAQYGLFSKFNNYDLYFAKFERNNGEVGVSFQVPLFAPGVSSQLEQTSTEVSHLRLELANARNRVSADLQQSFRDVKKAQTGAEVARLDLDVAREQLSVYLAQMEEGRVTLRQVEEARIAESDKWIAFYDAQYALEKARWSVLRLTGELVGSIEALP